MSHTLVVPSFFASQLFLLFSSIFDLSQKVASVLKPEAPTLNRGPAVWNYIAQVLGHANLDTPDGWQILHGFLVEKLGYTERLIQPRTWPDLFLQTIFLFQKFTPIRFVCLNGSHRAHFLFYSLLNARPDIRKGSNGISRLSDATFVDVRSLLKRASGICRVHCAVPPADAHNGDFRDWCRTKSANILESEYYQQPKSLRDLINEILLFWRENLQSQTYKPVYKVQKEADKGGSFDYESITKDIREQLVLQLNKVEYAAVARHLEFDQHSKLFEEAKTPHGLWRIKGKAPGKGGHTLLYFLAIFLSDDESCMEIAMMTDLDGRPDDVNMEFCGRAGTGVRKAGRHPPCCCWYRAYWLISFLF